MAVIQSYRSVENKRIALRKALARKPDDPKLQRILGKLTSADHISKAMKKGIFINYSRNDELLALEIAERLQKDRLYVWLDMLDIGHDEDWEYEIRRAIHGSGLMLSILSPGALRDQWVIRERQHFSKSGKLVIPVLSEPVDLSQVEFWLPPVDFTQGFNMGMDQLYGMLNLTSVVV